jgi:hypothetical protein
MSDERIPNGGLRRFLSLEDIVTVAKRRVQEVPIEGVGIFCLLEMSALERTDFVETMFPPGQEKSENVPAPLWAVANIAVSLCDDTGRRFYGGDSGRTFKELYEAWAIGGEFSPVLAQKLGPAALRLNGFMGDVEKNSDSAPASSSA